MMAQGFHEEHDHWRLSRRRGPHHGSSRRLLHNCHCRAHREPGEKYKNDVDPESTPYNIENKEKEIYHDGNEGINVYELLHALPLTPQNFNQH